MSGVRRQLQRLLRLAACATLLACGWAHGQSCNFSSAGSALNFGNLDPTSSATVTTFMDVVVRCNPGGVTPTWTFTGSNGSAPLRMKHTTLAQFLPYTIATQRISGPGANETWRLTGSVLAANYSNAPLGTYTDILTATVTP